MEIVPIIYKFLIIGGALLLIVIIISFLLSKSTRGQEKNFPQERNTLPQPMFMDHNSTQGHLVDHQPVIYPINTLEQREIKVIRKQSYEELDISNRTNGNKNGNRRYTILNEELKNSNYRYVNEG